LIVDVKIAFKMSRNSYKDNITVIHFKKYVISLYLYWVINQNQQNIENGYQLKVLNITFKMSDLSKYASVYGYNLLRT